MANSEVELVVAPIVSQVKQDNAKLISSLNALAGQYDLKVNLTFDAKKLETQLSNLQAKINQTTKTVSLGDFSGAKVQLKTISAVTAEKLKQKLANDQLLASERQRAAIEEANSKISIAHSKAKIQSDKEEISNSRVKLQLEQERIKLLQLAQREAKASPAALQGQLTGKINNSLTGNLSTVDTAALTKLRDELQKVDLSSSNARTRIKEFEAAYRDLQAQIKQGTVVDNSFGINTKSSEADLQRYIAGLKNVSAEHVKIQSSSTAAWGKDGSQIRTVNALVDEGAKGWHNYRYSINSSSQQVRELDNGMRLVNTTTGALTNTVKRLASQFFGIYTIIRAFRSSLGDLREIDTGLTALSKVTSLTADGFKQATIEAEKAASAYGRLIKDNIDAQTTFANAGKKNYEELAELAMLASSIGGPKVTQDLASDWLIASDAAYQLGGNVEKLISLMDSQANVANNQAVSIEKIAKATSVYANTAAIAGESTQTMTALLAAGIASTTKQGEEVGRSLRQLTLNIRRIKDESEDGIVDEKSMAKAEKALNSVNIQTREVVDGKTTSQVLGELAEKFESGALSAEQISKVMTDVGQGRQADILAAMIMQFDKYRQAMDDYANGAGTAARMAEKDLQSWEGKLNILSNTFTLFIAKTLDTSWIKGILDGVTFLIKSFDNLGTVLALLSTWLVVSKWQSIAAVFRNMGASITALGGGFKGLIAYIQNYSRASQHAKANNMSLAASYQAVGASANMAQLAIGGVLALVTIGIMAYNNWNQAQEEARQKAIEISEAFNNQIESIDQLKAKLDDESASRDTLIGLMESHNVLYGTELKNLQDINDVRSESIRLLDEEARAKAQETIRSLSGEYEKARHKLEDPYAFSNLMESPEAYLATLESQIDAYTTRINAGEEFSAQERDNLSRLTEAYNNMKAEVSELRAIVDQYREAQAVLNGTHVASANATNDAADAIDNLADSTSDISLDEFKMQLSEAAQGAKELEAAINAIDTGTFQEMLEGDTDAVAAIVEQFPQLRDELDLYVRGLMSADDLQKSFQATLDDFNVDNFISAFDEAYAIAEEFGDGTNRVKQAIQNLMATVPGLQNAMENLGVDLDVTKITSYDTAESFLAAAKAAVQLQITAQQTKLTELKNELSDAQEFARKAQNQFMQTGMSALLAGMSAEYAEGEATLEELKSILAQFDNVGVNAPKNQKKSKSSSKDPRLEAAEKDIEILEHKYKMAEISMQDFYDGLESIRKKYYDGEEKYASQNMALKERVYQGEQELLDLWLKGQEKLVDNNKGNYQNQVALYRGMIQKIEAAEAAHIAKGLDANSDYMDKLYSQRKDYVDKIRQLLIDDAKEKYDAEKEYLEKAFEDNKRAREKQHEAEIKALEEQNELLDDQLSYWRKIFEARKQALERADSARTYDQDIEESNKAISKLEADIAALAPDDSEATKAKRVELQEQLAEEIKALQEKEYQRGLDLKQQSLDDELSRIEENLNNEKKLIDDRLEYLKESYDNQQEYLELAHERTIDGLESSHNYLVQMLENGTESYIQSMASKFGILVAEAQSAATQIANIFSQIMSVTDFQNALMGQGHDLPRFGADGIIGKETIAAWQAYMNSIGANLSIDGIRGSQTKEWERKLSPPIIKAVSWARKSRRMK